MNNNNILMVEWRHEWIFVYRSDVFGNGKGGYIVYWKCGVRVVVVVIDWSEMVVISWG